MEVMHERVAGLDVHKAMIVACVRIILAGKIKRECRTFETSTASLETLLDWLTASRCTYRPPSLHARIVPGPARCSEQSDREDR
jgi:hypothetical protein